MVEDMSYEDVRKIVDGLSALDKSRLISDLIAQVKTGYRTQLCIRNCNRYVEVMGDLLGRDIRTTSKEQSVVWGRNLVAWQLFQDAFTEAEIADAMGKNHSTINYMKNQVKSMFSNPHMYSDEMILWCDFQERIMI